MSFRGWEECYVELHNDDEALYATGCVVSSESVYNEERNTTTLKVEFDHRGLVTSRNAILARDCGCVPERIVRNGPAMVVFWNDGTKTVVKCHEEEFDFEKGLAMALARKMWGRSRTLAYLKKVEEQATLKGGSCEV